MSSFVDMPLSSEVEDGPVVLQLKTWQDTSSQFDDLSKFDEGFISPTRRILLLHSSEENEAVLISFSSGILSESIPRSDLTNVSDTKSKFESCSVISGVQSISWGRFCESSGQLEDLGFDQLLIMSGERGIFVHLFPSPDKVKLTDPTSFIGELNGKWIDWGPPHEMDNCTNNWLRTYATDVELGVVENGKYMSKFPQEITVPSLGMAVSFNLYGTILEFLNMRGWSCGNTYQCSRIFSSPSNELIGLILNLKQNEVVDSADMCDSYKLLVVVARIHRWGLEWVFLGDLNKCLSDEPGRSTEWVDFQLSDNFLFCLSRSGLIGLWDLNASDLLVLSDILINKVVANWSFKRFLRASSSVLLGVIDELGVVYLASLDEIISDKALVASSLDPYLDPLTAWWVAGHKIGSLTFGSTMAEQQETHPLEAIRPWKRRKQIHTSGEIYPSGFGTSSNNESKLGKGFSPLRRVFLSPYQARDEMFSCLSPFGITRLVINRGCTKGRHIKIVHTELYVGLSQSKETYFDRDSVGCFFKGCLYLITRDALSVVLPSILIPNQTEHTVKLEGIGFECRGNLRAWQMEVLDRVLLYEGPIEADHLCLENGLDLRVSRMRHLQLALHYSKFDDIERSLNKLVDVNLAEEGVLRLLFTCVYQIFIRVGSENEVVLASRLISMAARFATKMIHKYALLNQNRDGSYSRRLCEMAYFLEVIRDLQSRTSARSKKLVEMEVDDTNLRDPGTETLIDAEDNEDIDTSNSSLALTLAESSTVLEEQAGIKRLVISENIKDMMMRWELSNLDLKSVVKDALKSGRLPLAVHQLRLLHQKKDEMVVSTSDEKSRNAFNEVREIGISIAYDLFVQGESDLAVATLERLGEDIELILRQLLFGTVRRSLRACIIEQMKKRGLLRLNDMRILDRVLLIERLYPRSSFWVAYQKSERDLSEQASLAFYVNESPIFCGEVDGAILGVWADISTNTEPPEPSDITPGGYWACAAVWSDAWDQRTIDRVVLDQHYQMTIQVPWESQFEYHIAHHNLQEILNILDTIPTSLQSESILTVNLENITPAQNQGIYIRAREEIESSYIDVPGVRILRHSYFKNSTLWLKTLIEKELAKRNIFLRHYWEGTGEIVAVLARAGLIFNSSEVFDVNDAYEEKSLEIHKVEDSRDTKLSNEGFHKLVVHFCIQHELPYLLDFYLDHHNLVGDHNSLHVLLDAVGDCQWGKWLLFSRLRGYEYEASFSNACWKLSRKLGFGGNGGPFVEIEEEINIIDDMIAEGVGEMAALATLMYATYPIEKFLSLETLDRPGLQEYPTMWKTLISACSDGDNSGRTNANKVSGKNVLAEYFNWRYGAFHSAGGDASLLQILQATFPKPVRRLVQLLEQGPFSLQALEFENTTLHRSDDYLVRCLRNSILKIAGDNKDNPTILEALVQKSIEKELFSAEENGSKMEQDLNRGRVLAVFSSLIGKRALELRSTDPRLDQSLNTNVAFDIQTILGPLIQSERSILQWVVPLAITSFDDSSVVASCDFLFELCGISFEMLRLDINALRRISSHCNRVDKTLALNLAKGLAEEYLKYDYLELKSQNQNQCQKMPPSKTLVKILQCLEEASLPVIEEEESCGFWLKTGTGDASHLRLKQSEASRYWNLVIDFCQVHHLPISTKYLALLANNNDWVGFLIEAQIGGFSADVVIQVAAKEIKDARLRAHVLSILRSMQSSPKKLDDEGFISANDESNTLTELFAVVAWCEKQKFPGEALLRKARVMRWPLLAIVASCFSDTSSLSCAASWLEITGSRLSLIEVDKIILEIAKNVGLAVEYTNKLPPESYNFKTSFDRQNAKRQRISEHSSKDSIPASSSDNASVQSSILMLVSQATTANDESEKTEEALNLLAEMVVLFCEKQVFLPLLRAFELFLPLCPLLCLIRSFQAFSQMRLDEASAYLATFSARTREESSHSQPSQLHDELLNRAPWLSSTAVKAAEAVLSTCPTLYEKRSFLQFLASADFGDDGSSAAYFKRLYWKINLAEPDLKTDWFDKLDDGMLLTELERRGRWEEARSWARQLETSNASWKSAVHHVTESQAEAMVSEWKEFLWDFPQERAALWGHCQALFVRYSFPPLQAGLFFLKHAEALEKEIATRELHEMLLLSLQWLSGTITQVPPVYPLHLLREIETRVWLLAVESESQSNSEHESTSSSSVQNIFLKSSLNFIEQTAKVVSKMDSHINATRARVAERSSGIVRENNTSLSAVSAGSKTKRKGKPYLPLRRTGTENLEAINESEEIANSEGTNLEVSVSGWEERVGQVEMERAVLSLLEFGQISAAKQLQQKLSPTQVPEELHLIDVALKLAKFASSTEGGEISLSVLDETVRSVLRSLDLPIVQNKVDLSEALDALTYKCGEGRGRGLCLRVIAIVRAAMMLGLSFSEAFAKQPLELLQLLALKAQCSFEEATLLVETHSLPPPSIALILAESFLKGLLAAHRGGCLENQKEEGPEPLLWRSCDFLKWAVLCPSEPEIGHALMRVVMTGQEVPRACEVEILILAHHFYMNSACLDGIDVLVTFVANRVESYVLEDDFSSLARLVTGVAKFQSLSFILDILIENGQLELLLKKYSAAAEAATGSVAAVRGFRMAVLTSLKRYNPHDLDAFAMVYNHFDMKHDAANLLESRSTNRIQYWLSLRDRDRREHSGELLDSMRHLIVAAEALSTIDAGQRTHHACARASLLTLQIRIPDITWVQLSETNARRILVEQSRFQEALVVAEAYGLNQPMEWAPVFWALMLKPDLIEQFVAEFVAVLPLQPSMLHELARFYRSEVTARGDQSHFSVWLSPGGLPAEWVKHLNRSFRSLLKRTRDLRVRMQLAVHATGFADVVEACLKLLDKVPENAGPLVLRRGHGGAYLPLM
ncbi:hypothetical protein LUZ61_005063 [Rhynchospora tenuis]|uniref:Spatacsin C-terminal domain-containing protein n=1 Tax=Rhynchospora tenuis TaxID=198213 RepID=A0AAD5ZP36_9POAL|nr:hypothetical protein LUZ61_005063 [Rhynchospora tenuis]